jgi:hypothetical protein
MKIKHLLPPALCLFITPQIHAAEWEIKTDLKYTDGAVSDVTSYEDNGDFDKRKVKKKRKTKNNTLLTYTEVTQIPELNYELRLGHIFERNKEYNVQLKKSGKIKKDKSLTEFERITYAGLGALYTQKQFLGADLWVIKARYDHYLHVSYGANDLQKDAKPISGDFQNGYEWAVKAQGEYSTPWISLYLQPFLRYKEEYRDAWYNEATGDWKEEEREERYEAGLYLNWLPSIAGMEVSFGPYWQKERDYERERGSDWESEDDERWIGRFKLEYEAPYPGFEMELVFEQDLNGEDQGERVYNIELSYEF